jgi:hypothetical protein
MLAEKQLLYTFGRERGGGGVVLRDLLLITLVLSILLSMNSNSVA